MRIILIEPFGHKGGHHPIEARKLAFYLSKLNHEILLVTSEGFMHVNGIDVYDCCPIINIRSEIKNSKLKSLLYKLANFSKSLIALLNTCFSLSFSYKKAISDRYDILFLVSGSLSSFLLFGSIFRRIPFGFILRDWNRSLYYSDKKNRINWKVQNYLLHIAKFVNKKKLFFTHIGDELFNAYNKSGFMTDCEYVPPVGIEKNILTKSKLEARKQIGCDDDAKVLLVFGKGHYGKDFETIFKALEYISGYLVVFAGQMTSINNASLLLGKYNLNSRVIVYDKFIPENEIVNYFCSADALLMSYNKNFSVDSGIFALGIQYQLPFIASDVGEIGKLVKDWGLGVTFEANNSASLVKALQEYNRLSQEDFKKINRNINSFAESRSWNSVVKKYLNIFYSMIEHK